MVRTFLLVLAIAWGSFAAPDREPQGKKKLRMQPFGKLESGEQVYLYTLRNKHGVEAAITNFGGIIVSLRVPDRSGRLADVVLGFDNLNGYLKRHPYFGAIVGRYGNRIAQGRFSIDGEDFTLPRNNGNNHLHGGLKGFDKVLWKARDVSDAESPKLELTYLSRDGEEGYPGNLPATVTYSLTEKDELRIEYSATTDKPTIVNLTNHSYFNLAGQGNGDILLHQMLLSADRITPINAELIPTGELKPVDGTAFDFRKSVSIGARINSKEEQLVFGKGYDHNFVIRREDPGLALAARVTEPGSGRVMEVLTTQPGVQFYTGNFLDGSNRGKGGNVYNFRSGFCLETQHFPDSPNQPNFPSTVLRPGERYQTTTVYRFSTSP